MIFNPLVKRRRRETEALINFELATPLEHIGVSYIAPDIAVPDSTKLDDCNIRGDFSCGENCQITGLVVPTGASFKCGNNCIIRYCTVSKGSILTLADDCVVVRTGVLDSTEVSAGISCKMLDSEFGVSKITDFINDEPGGRPVRRSRVNLGNNVLTHQLELQDCSLTVGDFSALLYTAAYCSVVHGAGIKKIPADIVVGKHSLMKGSDSFCTESCSIGDNVVLDMPTNSSVRVGHLVAGDFCSVKLSDYAEMAAIQMAAESRLITIGSVFSNGNMFKLRAMKGSATVLLCGIPKEVFVEANKVLAIGG